MCTTPSRCAALSNGAAALSTTTTRSRSEGCQGGSRGGSAALPLWQRRAATLAAHRQRRAATLAAQGCHFGYKANFKQLFARQKTLFEVVKHLAII